jgi:heme exporter protein A
VKPPAITLQDVTCRFGHLTALQNIDLTIPEGQAFTLFGPNGAGKSTMLRLIATLGKPSSGDILVHDINVSNNPETVRKNIGLISHQTLLYDDLTAPENLAFYGKMYGLQNLNQRIDEVLRAVGLEHRQNDRVRNFSRGMKQRLAIARSILHKPSILLLDEPFTGLDTSAQSMLSNMIVDLKTEGRTIFLVTHDLGQGLSLADHFGILNRGKLVHKSSTENLNESDLQSLYEKKVEHPPAP